MAMSAPSNAPLPRGGWAYPKNTHAPQTAVEPAPYHAVTTAISAPVVDATTSNLIANPTPDPMAQRADAPIFQLGSEAQRPQDPATPNGSRYYSVHRQSGRQPDRPQLPAPNYLDALPVELSTSVTSEDLATPPAAPQMIRDANGRLRAVADLEDPL